MGESQEAQKNFSAVYDDLYSLNSNTSSEDFSIHYDSVDNFDDTISYVENVSNNQQTFEDPNIKELINQIKLSHCLFTWKLIPRDKNIVSKIENKYGSNLDILNDCEFTFVR